MLNEKDIEEIATGLYENMTDMDSYDYEEEKKQILSDIENALYNIKAIAQNDYNQNYWRTFWNALQLLNL